MNSRLLRRFIASSIGEAPYLGCPSYRGKRRIRPIRDPTAGFHLHEAILFRLRKRCHLDLKLSNSAGDEEGTRQAGMARDGR